jgi:penicillin G amidase
MPGFLGFFAPVLRGGLGLLSRLRLPKTEGALRLKGLTAPVEVLRDHWGVPHIYGQNIHDVYFAQGFLHAQDRLWQMDLNRRVVAGRLSEVMGARTVDVDRWLRVIGMRRVAEKEAALIRPDTLAELKSYAAGVNAAISQGSLPVEFTLLGYTPEPWTPVDTLSWVKMMAWSLSVNWETEILRAQLIARLGPERAAELEMDYSDRWPYIVPPGVDYSVIGSAALERARAARAFTGPSPAEGLGSNNWVVSGSRTVSGKPLLANDMHLSLSLPSIWYENHLVGDGLNVTGTTFPGVPGVIAGHNQHVAWGYTNGFPDVQDLFIEHLRRGQNGRPEYEYKGEWLPAEVVREVIQVKGRQLVTEEVIITRHGPIINALAPDFIGEQPLALCWTALDPELAMDAVSDLNRARNCQELRESLRAWGTPIQNTVYADVHGDIAYSFPGRVPVRARGDGSVPVPGWTGEYDWAGYVPYAELPHLYNPPQGYVATANNRVVRDDYPHWFGREHCSPYRAARIVELLEAQDKVDAGCFQRMQFDKVSIFARSVGQALGRLAVDDPELAGVVERMRAWDGVLSADSAAAAVHKVFVQRMLGLVLEGKLGDLAERYIGKGPTPLLADSSMYKDKAVVWLEKLLAAPESPWYDLGHGEQRDEVMRIALRQTVDWLKETLGPRMDDWAWGKLHAILFPHMLGQVKALAPFLSRGPHPLGGDGTTVCATGGGAPRLGGHPLTGAPFRFVADLSDWDKCMGVLTPGQSGRQGSPHYDDQLPSWLQGEYRPMHFSRQAVERGAEKKLVLEPAGQ